MNTVIMIQMQIKGHMPLVRYMRAQALLVHLCQELEIVEERFAAQWIMIPQAELDHMLVRLGYAWVERRRLYLSHHPVTTPAHVRLSSTLPDWFREGVLLARRAKRYADG